MRKIFNILVILVFLISFLPPNKASANPALFGGRVVAGTVGEKVIISIMERQGVKFASKKARQRAVERYNIKLQQKINEANKYGDQLRAAELARFQDTVVKLTSASAKPKNKDLSQIVLNSALFLIGADVVIEVANEIKLAHEQDKALERMQDIQTMLEEGEAYTSYGNLTMWDVKTSSSTSRMFGDKTGTQNIHYKSVGGVSNKEGAIILTAVVFNLRFEPYFGDFLLTYDETFSRMDGSPLVHYESTWKDSKITVKQSALENNSATVLYKPKIDEVPQITPVTIPSDLPIEIPIVIPNDDNDISYPYPWNDPFPTGEPNPDPDKEPQPEPLPNPEAVDKPFLEKLFIPRKNFMDEAIGGMGDIIRTKFPFMVPFLDVIKIFILPSSCRPLDNITANLYENEYTVVDFQELNDKASVFRPWIKGLIWLVVIAYVIRKITAMISGQGGK